MSGVELECGRFDQLLQLLFWLRIQAEDLLGRLLLLLLVMTVSVGIDGVDLVEAEYVVVVELRWLLLVVEKVKVGLLWHLHWHLLVSEEGLLRMKLRLVRLHEWHLEDGVGDQWLVGLEAGEVGVELEVRGELQVVGCEPGVLYIVDAVGERVGQLDAVHERGQMCWLWRWWCGRCACNA